MPRLSILLFSSTLVILSLGLAQQATGPSQEVDALRQQWADLYNQGDMAALAGLYTEDAVLYDSTGAVFEGRQAIQENFQTGFDQGATEIEISPVESEIWGDSAYDLGRFLLRTADGQTVREGYYLAITRRVNGEWRIQRHIANMVAPQAETAE